MKFYKKFKASFVSLLASFFIIFFAIYYQGFKQNAWDVVLKLFAFVCSPLNLIAFSFDWPRYMYLFAKNKKRMKYQQFKDMWIVVLLLIGLIASLFAYLGYL